MLEPFWFRLYGILLVTRFYRLWPDLDLLYRFC